jgi:spore coat protein A, manganese oxidase
MLSYDHVGPSGSRYPSTIKEYVNNTVWNGLESPSIAYDFPGDGISELPRQGSIEAWQILYLSDMPGGHPVHLHLRC